LCAITSISLLPDAVLRLGATSLDSIEDAGYGVLEIKLDRVRVRNTSDRKGNISELESEIPPTENEISQS
jgi:hypothetical protein